MGTQKNTEPQDTAINRDKQANTEPQDTAVNDNETYTPMTITERDLATGASVFKLQMLMRSLDSIRNPIPA